MNDNNLALGFLCKIKLDNEDLYILTIYCQYSKIKVVNINKKSGFVMIINKSIIFIPFTEIGKEWEFDDNNFCWIQISEKVKDNIKPLIEPIEIDENIFNTNYDIKEYNNRLIYIPFLEENETNQIETNIGIVNIDNNDSNDFSINSCQINVKNTIGGLPVFLVNNLKMIGIYYGGNENNKKGKYFKYFMNIYNDDKKIYYIYCFLNLRRNTTNKEKCLNVLIKNCPNDHNNNIYAVEVINNKIQASIDSLYWKQNGQLYQFNEKQRLENCELSFYEYSIFCFNMLALEYKKENTIQEYHYKMARCPDNICPSIKEGRILNNIRMKIGNQNYKLLALETRIITPLVTKIKTILCQNN